MIFKFITDLNISSKDILISCYNLFLLYFYYDIIKFLISEFRFYRRKSDRV